MDWAEWEPLYAEVLDDFGFSRRADEEAARLLEGLLHGKRRARDRDLRRVFEDREVVVAGPALEEAPPRTGALVAAGAATTELMRHGRHPDVIVTDLDGPVEDQVRANACCSIAVLHAHGDNMPALQRWAPQFQGLVLGTCQCEPIGGLLNVGGFTDGDRACFLAAHHGAERIVLAGFDFDHPMPKEGRDPEVKRRKLAWARKLLGMLDVPVEGL